MSDYFPIYGPAALVPAGAEMDALVAELVAVLTAEVKAVSPRDDEKLDRAARAAIADIEIHLDYDPTVDGDPVYTTAADVSLQVFDALVVIGAANMKRAGFAFGLAGYDEADPAAVRARGAALAAIATGHKARWGVA